MQLQKCYSVTDPNIYIELVASHHERELYILHYQYFLTAYCKPTALECNKFDFGWGSLQILLWELTALP